MLIVPRGKSPAPGPLVTALLRVSDIAMCYPKLNRVQRKSVLQPAIWASCSYQIVPAHKSFQPAPKPFLISRSDYNPSVNYLNFTKKQHLPIGLLKSKNH